MNDEKIASDYKIQGGSVLHLVLALRLVDEHSGRSLVKVFLLIALKGFIADLHGGGGVVLKQLNSPN